MGPLLLGNKIGSWFDLSQPARTTGNSPVDVGEPSVRRHPSQVCSDARLGDPFHADFASGPRVGISAGISARVRSLRDAGGGSAPDSEDSQIGSGIDFDVDDYGNSQSHFRVGIWLVFVDALMVMLPGIIYLLLTHRQSHWGEPETVRTMAAVQTHKK